MKNESIDYSKMKIGSNIVFNGNNLLKPIKMKLIDIKYLPIENKYSYKFKKGDRTQYVIV